MAKEVQVVRKLIANTTVLITTVVFQTAGVRGNKRVDSPQPMCYVYLYLPKGILDSSTGVVT